MITVTLNINGPRDPGYVLEVAEATEQSVRVLGHLTRAHDSLKYPSEADALLRHLSAAAAGYPQLLAQVLSWLEAEHAAARIRVADGPFTGDPAGAITEVRTRLDTARTAAQALWAALSFTAEVTNDLGATEEEQASGLGDH